MPENPPKEEILSIIKELENNPQATQRTISGKLGISLGKINYLLKELIKKGFIKARNFSKNPGKIRKIDYILTKEGFEEKLRLMQHFLEKKEAEYIRIKAEWEKLVGDKNIAPTAEDRQEKMVNESKSL